MNRDDGFTLIELLVVILVLNVLVGLVLLGTREFQEQSEAAACRAEIDSLKTANITYVAKHGSSAPSDDVLLAEGYIQRPPKYASLTNGVTDPATMAGCNVTSSTTVLALTPGGGVAALSGTAAPAGASGGWKTDVTVTVHDDGGAPISGIEVIGQWSDGTNARRCTTGADGTCSFNTHHDDATTSAKWTLSTVGGETGDNAVSIITCTKVPGFGCA